MEKSEKTKHNYTYKMNGSIKVFFFSFFFVHFQEHKIEEFLARNSHKHSGAI